MIKSLTGRVWPGYCAIVLMLHIIGVLCLFFAAKDNMGLIGLGFLAYTLGLRHAFDADHIAGIDNTVRKLVQQGQKPHGVGFFFSLGHSTVVFLMAVATAFATQWAQNNISWLKDFGGIIGTSVSGVFLVIIGVINLIVLVDIYKVFLQLKQKSCSEPELDEMLNNRGFMARFLSPLFRFINKSWHVYPIGFLFGLGFDTASEVALLAISAGAAKSEVCIAGIIALPVLFASGMSLLDTADGIFMSTAYNWAFSTPLRKIYYNITVTGLSVVAALFIGSVELLQVITPEIGLTDGIWKKLQELDFGSLGGVLVILFVLAWMTSYGIWKFSKLEERWG